LEILFYQVSSPSSTIFRIGSKIDILKIGITKIGVREIGFPKISILEICSNEISTTEKSSSEINLYIRILISPLIPD